MYKSIKSKEVHQRSIIGISFSLLLFYLGCKTINEFYSTQKPPTEFTSQFFIGLTLTAISAVSSFFFIKYLFYFRLKRLKRLKKIQKTIALRNTDYEKNYRIN